MRILFDQGVPRGLAASLRSHDVIEARKLKWERISNGALLKLAEDAGFNLLLTTDKSLRYQQNLADRKISIVVLGQSPWWLVRQHLEAIVAAVDACKLGELYRGGNSLRVSPRVSDRVSFLEAGLVVRPEEWRWSSVHDFSGRAAGPIVADNVLAIDPVELPLDQRARI